MKRGLKYSIALHVGLILLMVFGLPTFFSKTILPQEQVVTIEVLPVSGITNVKPHKKVSEIKPKKDKKVTSAVEPKPSKPVHKEAEKEIAKKTEPLPKPIVKKESEVIVKKLPDAKPKPQEKKEDKKAVAKKKPVVPEDSFASVLNSVEEFQKKDDKKDDKKEKTDDMADVEDFLAKAQDNEYKPGLPLSLSEKDAIRQQIMNNWTVLAGAKGLKDMIVTLKIQLAKDGSVVNVENKNLFKYNSDQFYKAVVDSAMRAVYKSSPLKNLPAEKYDVRDGWQELELNFDPSEMLY